MYSKNSSENSDSDSSLQNITDIFPPRSQDISPGDIVWAKFKYLYWPALVRAYYPKEKKISIWYCDDPGKTFKLPLKNIYLFHDSEMYKKILKDVKDAGVLKEHEGLKAHASTYLRRKQEGYQDDPMKFFDQTYPFFLVEEMLKKDPNADVSDIKIRPMYIDHARKETIRKKLSVRNNESDDSELESSDSDSETKTNTSDFISNVNMQLHDISSRSSKDIGMNDIGIDKILKCILSGTADNYLQKIKFKKIPSEYRDLYEKSLKRKSMNEVSFTGPINDDNKLRKLIFYLLPLYEKMDNPLKNKSISSGKCKALATSSSFKDKTTKAQYVASVFLPESIIFAISKVKKISLAEAKKLFVGKSECRTKAIESILAHADRYIETTEQTEYPEENVVQSKEHGTSKQKRSKKSVHPSKKVCIDKSDTMCKKKEILATDLKSHKCVKIDDAVKSNKTSSSKNEYEEFVGKSECRTKAIESNLAYADPCIQTKEKIKSPVENVVQNKEHGASKQKRSKKSVPPSKKVCIDKSDTICKEKEILTTDLKPRKFVKIDDAVKSNETSSSKNKYEEFVGKSETKAIESSFAHANRYIQTKEKTECPVENVVQNNERGTSKQKRSKKSVPPSKKVCTDKSDTICDEKEILTSGLKSHTKCVKTCNVVKSNETSSSKTEYEDRILSYILSGKADDYLKKIKLKCIPSKHLDLYEELVKGGKKELCNITYTGPIKDDNKLKELILHLLHLYDGAKDSHRTKRSAAKKCKSAMTAYYNDKKNPAVQYVIYVWLPESIILAISEIENVAVPEAEKLFDKYAEAKLVASLLKSLDPDFSG